MASRQGNARRAREARSEAVSSYIGKGIVTPGQGGGASAFAMTQLSAANRVYQRSSKAGGGQGKGSGAIPVTLNVTKAGTLYARCRSAADGTTILQPAWLVGNIPVANGPVTVSGVDARLGWFFLDLSVDGVTWQNGTVPVGMGRVVTASGQSLAVRLFGDVSNTGTMASLGVTPDDNGAVYATYSDPSRPASGQTAAWAKPADGTQYDSAFAAEFLRREIARAGINCGFVGHAVGATAIATWVPGGANNPTLRQRLDEAGGFEAAIWFHGHSDAGAGTSKATYKAQLDALFADLAVHNPIFGSAFSKLLCAIPNINSGSWGTQVQRDEIRQAHLEWAQANNAIYSIPVDITLSDGVHQANAGNPRLAERFSAGLAGSAVSGPALTLTTPAYGAGASGFGNEMTAGYGMRANAQTEATVGQYWTMEGVISISAAPASTKVAFGQGGKGWIGVASDGRLVANYQSTTGGSAGEIYIGGGTATGGNSNPIMTDGLRHHVELSVGPAGAWLFVDGALVGTSSIAPATAAATSDMGVRVFGAAVSFQWTGTVDEVAMWATTRHTVAFTKPSAPYAGNEPALAALFHLNGDGSALMAA